MDKNELIRVWDPLVRLFHWTLVGSFTIAYFTQELNYAPHLYSGYTVLSLIAIRIVWGFVGGHYARFNNFIYGPKAILNYLRSIFDKNPDYFLGHNPAGGIMVVFLLVLLLTVCVSGVALDAAENRAGPLANSQLFLYTDIIAQIHVYSTNITVFLVAIHFIGVVMSSILLKENLIRAMVTGKKPRN